MAFAAEDKSLVNEMLGAFEGGTFDWYQYNDRITGEITSVPLHNQIDFVTVQTQLGVLFTAIEAASDNREQRIKDITAEYKDISFDVTRIGIGGGSGASGARYDPDEKRAHLKDLLERNLGLQIRQVGSGQFRWPGGQGGRMIGVVR